MLESAIMSKLEIDYRTEIEPRTNVLTVRGRVTHREAPLLRRRLFAAIDDSRERLVVALEGVETMDTAAVAVLVEGLLATRQKSTEIFFCTPSASVRAVFKLAGLEQALERCYGCLGDALAKAA